jgi:hypothetical protein
MSSKSSKPPEREDLPVEEEEIATSQEGIPVPWQGGTRRLAVRWITPAFDMITKEAPAERAGKK